MKNKELFLKQIYNQLNDYFGPRGWWPGETALEIVIGAILTQSVAWRNVEKAINNLKVRGVICNGDDRQDLRRLKEISLEELGELIRPTLYFNQKAKKIKAFVEYLDKNYCGNLSCMFEGDLFTLRAELLSIWGIGEETADSILLYAGHKPIFVVDAYTRRIYHRIGLFDEAITYHAMQQYFMENLAADVPFFNQYHAVIVGLGNRICLSKNPLCEECPLNNLCLTGGQKLGRN